MNSPTYDAVNKAWKSTCKVLFGAEVGELEDFSAWLEEYLEPRRCEKSALNGQDVYFSVHDYAKGAKFIAFEEVDFNKKFQPLSINEIKDIDSIELAVRERVAYAGSISLGNSHYVQGSNNVINGNFIYQSEFIRDSKYVAHSIWITDAEFMFGMGGCRTGTHAMKCMGGQYTRCFECPSSEYLSDCYYCPSAKNCIECMFCFGAQNCTHSIGNMKLPKDKYAQLKEKLLSEIAHALKRDKRIFSSFELLEVAKKQGMQPRGVKMPIEKHDSFSITPIEDAFSKTSSIIFGKPLRGIEKYGKWLQKHIPQNKYFASPFTNEEAVVAGYRAYLTRQFDIGGRLLPEIEIREIGKIGVNAQKLAQVEFAPHGLCSVLGEIAYSDLNKIFGNITNVSRAAVLVDCSDCFEGSAYSKCKKCAYCFWPDGSEYVFGSQMAWKSGFCINCYNSNKLQRCFEVDAAQNCSDSYFLHNCENVQDSMFCFNAKNLHYAIGNAALPAEKFASMKGALLAQMHSELQKKKDLRLDIYNIGAAQASRQA